MTPERDPGRDPDIATALEWAPMSEVVPEVTRLLQAASAGDTAAAQQVVAVLYRELRALAHSRLRRSGEFTLLDTTALVHEGWLRLRAQDGLAFTDRRQFFAYAARAMHSVVVDLARARQAVRRGGAAEHLALDTAVAAQLAGTPDDEVLRVHEALAELAALEPRLAAVVEMRYFAGFSDAEIAQALDLTERTVQRDWHKARLLLSLALQ